MNPRSESDEWLMGQVRRGSRDALEKLVRRHASPLLTYVQRMCGDRHRGEELFQEVFLAVWTKRTQYKLDRPFRAWLYAIAANRCRDAYRARPSEVPLAGDEGPVAARETGPTQTAIAAETATLVAAAVGQLPPQQRSVVVLRVWNGLSYGEIAELVGTTEATVRSHMHRGLAALRERLEPRLR